MNSNARMKWNPPTPSVQSLASLTNSASKIMSLPSSDILLLKNNRMQAEISVQLMANRIALLKAEEERAKRRIRAMNITVEKVQICQKEELELRKQLQTARQQVQKNIEETANRVKQQSIEAKQKLKLRLENELRKKQMQVREDREKSLLLKSAREQIETFPGETVEGIRQMKQQLRKRKEESEERLRQKLEEKREQRLRSELNKRNQAEKRLVKMAELEQRMLENLMNTRSMQKKVYSQYERLFR